MPSMPEMVSLAEAMAAIWSAQAGMTSDRAATAELIRMPAPTPEAMPKA